MGLFAKIFGRPLGVAAKLTPKLDPPIAYGPKPDNGYVPDWPDTGNEHDWRSHSMGLWHCPVCDIRIQVLPDGRLSDCRIFGCAKPWGGVHLGPRGWWHAANGTFSEFARTKREAEELFQANGGPGLGPMSQPTPPPPINGCRPLTECPAIILGSMSDFHCGEPVTGRTKNNVPACTYHLNHPMAELVEKMTDWDGEDKSIERFHQSLKHL